MDQQPAFPPDFQLFLASESPRRHSLLREIGVPFTVVASTAREELSGDSPAVLAQDNARAKVEGALIPAEAAAGAFVLGTDTVVHVAGQVLGKPGSAAEARSMLGLLSGITHEVVSGVALGRVQNGRLAKIRVASALTEVSFLPLKTADIEAYLASGEWRGKAGAYAIQGLAGLFVREIRGEYSNVVGLPLCLLGRLFREEGFDLLGRHWLDRS